MQITPCHVCKGQRLKPESLAVTVGEKNIYEITSMSIALLTEFLNNLKLTQTQEMIGSQVLKEIKARVGFLMDVGLEYLTLSRATGTLLVEKLRGFVWLRRSVPVWWAWHIFWMNPVSVSIREIMINC